MKQSSTSVVVMSDAERRERLRNRIYAVFPVVSVLLLILLWFLAAGATGAPLYRLSLRAAPGLGAIDDHVVWHR